MKAILSKFGEDEVVKILSEVRRDRKAFGMEVNILEVSVLEVNFFDNLSKIKREYLIFGKDNIENYNRGIEVNTEILYKIKKLL